MIYVLFAILMFCPPHLNWIPLKLGVLPETIPLGLMNWIFISSFLLWTFIKSSVEKKENPIKQYNIFFIITCLSLVMSLFNSFEEVRTTLSLFKNQTILLCLFYIPLSTIKDEHEFKKVLYIMLVIDVFIGLEVVRSGVLAGINYNDSKRGSGPFSEGLTGSDIAGSYLAQVLMFLCAVVFVTSFNIYQRVLVVLGALVILFGVYATYARGALVGCIVGFLSMLPFLGFKTKYLIIAGVIISIAYILMPNSLDTRFDKTTTESGEFDESTQGRFYYWNAALQIIIENPLGVGVGQMRGAMQSKIGKHVDPHNGFLYTACEYGVIGLIVFCFLLVNLYKKSRDVWKDENNPLIYRVYALGMAGMIGAFVTCNMFYANFYKDLVMGTVVIHFGMLAFILADIKSKKEIIIS